MRAHTTTTTQAKQGARRRVIALAVAVCSLAIPATAGAASDVSSVTAITGGSQQSGQPSGGSDVSTVNSITGGSSQPSSTVGSPYGGGADYAAVNAITGPASAEPTIVASAPANDGFDWGDAALGAGAALALAAFAGAAMLTVRRRTAVAASTS